MLKILGIVFLIIIGLLVLFFIWIGIKVKQGVDQQARVSAIEEGMKTPPIVLEPTDDPALVQPEAIAALREQATGLGATDCGNFDIPVANARIFAYCLETPAVYVIVYDHDQVDPWTDVALRFDEDHSFTASTVPEIARGAPRDPRDEIVYFAPGTDIGVLVRAAAERAENETAMGASPEAFQSYFEEAARKSQEYIQSQSVSQDWLEAIAEDAGVELTGDEAAQINLGREAQLIIDTEDACFRSLAESGDYTAAQWNDLRERLVAVWDDMPGEYVSAVFYNFVDYPDDLQPDVESLERGRGSARERVAQLNERLPGDKRLVLVGRVSSPVEADVYRGQITFV